VPLQTTDRAALLRRLGSVLAGVERLPRHPHWRFAFLSYLTTDPLFVALQYGVQDAVALVGCTAAWGGSPNGDAAELAKAVDLAVSEKVDGIGVPVLGSELLEDAVGRATVAGIPAVALNVRAPGGLRLPHVGMASRPAAARIAARVAAKLRSGEVAVLAGDRELIALRPLADALVSAIGRSGRLRASVVSTGMDVYAQLGAVAEYVAKHRDVRGLVALDTGSTEALGVALSKLGPRRPFAAGSGVLPATLKLVAEGTLDFTIDEQPYEQGFMAALQLFLTKLSGGLLAPADVRTGPVFVTTANVGRYRNTRTRFEGSSSKQKYPIA
jgi:simple sugar transport system substrate-binding protein